MNACHVVSGIHRRKKCVVGVTRKMDNLFDKLANDNLNKHNTTDTQSHEKDVTTNPRQEIASKSKEPSRELGQNVKDGGKEVLSNDNRKKGSNFVIPKRKNENKGTWQYNETILIDPLPLFLNAHFNSD